MKKKIIVPSAEDFEKVVVIPESQDKPSIVKRPRDGDASFEGPELQMAKPQVKPGSAIVLFLRYRLQCRVPERVGLGSADVNNCSVAAPVAENTHPWNETIKLRFPRFCLHYPRASSGTLTGSVSGNARRHLPAG